MVNKISIHKRITSILIDGVSIFTICSISSIVFFITNLKNDWFAQIFITAFAYTIILCKDLIMQGRSIGKQYANLKIIDIRSDEPASNLKLILRNFFTFLWPIEIIVCCLNPEKKLGDIIFGTKVIFSNSSEMKQSHPLSRLLYFSITLFIVFMVFYLIIFYLIKSNSLVRLLFEV